MSETLDAVRQDIEDAVAKLRQRQQGSLRPNHTERKANAGPGNGDYVPLAQRPAKRPLDNDPTRDVLDDQDADSETAQHSGHMIGFFLEPTMAQRLAVGDAEEPPELHMTVAYLPDGAPPEVDHAVAALAAQTPPFHGMLTGTASFPPEDEMGSAFHATAVVPGLESFRGQLIDQLTRMGATVGDPERFSPHVTLKYVRPGEQPPAHPLSMAGAAPIPIRLATITVARGSAHTDFPLKG
jgi:2'-5' RNA ligase